MTPAGDNRATARLASHALARARLGTVPAIPNATGSLHCGRRMELIMVRNLIRVLVPVFGLLLASTAASAQTVQSVQIGVGGVFPRGLDGRTDGDVLVRNYFGAPMPGDPSLTDALAFRISDFKTGQIFGEWNVAVGRHIEFGAGVGFYRRTVPTVYLDLVDQDGFEIEQELKLRVVPLTALVRFLPFGGPNDVQPYVGAGISALRFHYSEVGDFVDPDTLDIFPGRFSTNGTAVGGLLLGGLRIPLNGDIYGLGLEGRYQWGEGDLPEGEFVGDKIDLSGGQFNVTFLVRF
jgi:hypothetical protein